jgi:alpha,alpha-trehalose phosphorylase
MRARDGCIRFDPRLPDGITRLDFRLCYRGRRLRVVVTGDTTTYHLLEGNPLSVMHHGEEFLLGDQPATLPTSVTVTPDCWIRQPRGREPLPRRAGGRTRHRSQT